jgi:hypothetical protein
MGVSGQRHAQAALYLREKDHRYPLGLRAGLDKKITERILLCRGSNLYHQVIQSVVTHYTD